MNKNEMPAAPLFSELSINSERMIAIADELRTSGHYTMANSVDRITKQRDEMHYMLEALQHRAERAEALAKGLVNFTHHHPDCLARRTDFTECNCGLSEARKALEDSHD